MNKFMNGLRKEDNFTLTENGAVTHKSTLNALCDFFALGAAYRTRSDADCILLFKNAYEEDPIHALKCLFYMRDVRGGQGERRFFRVVYRWLIENRPSVARRNLQYLPEYGRWDDLIYVCYNTSLWADCVTLVKNQLNADMQSLMKSDKEGISLLAKWMPSINTSSAKTKEMGNCLRQNLSMTHKQYRKTLAALRDRINVLERLMSAGRWDEIEFDKIPSKAGFKYRNAFARHDLERAKSEKNVRTYEDFMSDKETKVNAKDLYPYEIVDQAINLTRNSFSWWSRETDDSRVDPVQRNVVNKYWDNFLESIDDLLSLDALAVVDTSGSMLSGGIKGGTPMDVAISLGMCLAEKARGPFAGHYISFSSRPQLIKVEGIDFVDKVRRIYRTNLCENTDIEATFDMMLKTALLNDCTQEDLPECLVVISDMQFDMARGYYSSGSSHRTLMENIEKKWNAYGYKMPRLVFWNVNAKTTGGNIPMEMKEGITFVSGMSPSIFQQLCSGKTALEFVLQVLDSERYAVIQ